jgi:hypothetical protein
LTPGRRKEPGQLYYKACGKPWKVADAREGVCYIGIAYQQSDADPKSRSACCAAQMFIDALALDHADEGRRSTRRCSLA